MPERPRPSEGQPSPMILAIESTREFFEKIEENPQFINLRNRIMSKLGDNSMEANENATKMVKSGTGLAMQRIGLLPAFADPEKRKEILEQFKRDKVEAPWVNILANWDVASDPNGIGVLSECKNKDLEEMKSSAETAENEQQKQSIMLQMEAMASGQDLIIDIYKKGLQKPAQKHAA